MGKLIDGEWIVKSIITTDDSGAYDRLPRTFLDTIEDGHPIFQPELGRYHLYVSYACLLYTSPSPRDVEESRMPSSA